MPLRGRTGPIKIAVTLSFLASAAALAGTSACREVSEERPRVRVRRGRHACIRTVAGHRKQRVVG